MHQARFGLGVAAIVVASIAVASWSPARASSSRPERATTPPISGADIAVSVLPGPLAISTSETALVLHRRPGRGNTTRYEGELPNVQVVDARATPLGWSATITLVAPEGMSTAGVRLFVHPSRINVISGAREGVEAVRPRWTSFNEQVPVFGADQGYGRGTYADDATITLVLPYASDAQSLTLAFEAAAV